MICPLMSTIEDTVSCIKENCAWWLTKEADSIDQVIRKEGCAIKILAEKEPK